MSFKVINDDIVVACDYCGKHNKNGKLISSFQDRETLSIYDLHKKCVKFLRIKKAVF